VLIATGLLQPSGVASNAESFQLTLHPSSSRNLTSGSRVFLWSPDDGINGSSLNRA
jgi:hypothetical protein